MALLCRVQFVPCLADSTFMIWLSTLSSLPTFATAKWGRDRHWRQSQLQGSCSVGQAAAGVRDEPRFGEDPQNLMLVPYRRDPLPARPFGTTAGSVTNSGICEGQARPARFWASTRPRGVGKKIHDTNPSASSENAAFRTVFKCELASCSRISPVERICGR